MDSRAVGRTVENSTGAQWSRKRSVVPEARPPGQGRQPAPVPGRETAGLRRRLRVHQLGRVVHVVEPDEVAELVQHHRVQLGLAAGPARDVRQVAMIDSVSRTVTVRVDLPGRPSAAAIGGDGTVYVVGGDDNGQLWAIGPEANAVTTTVN